MNLHHSDCVLTLDQVAAVFGVAAESAALQERLTQQQKDSANNNNGKTNVPTTTAASNDRTATISAILRLPPTGGIIGTVSGGNKTVDTVSNNINKKGRERQIVSDNQKMDKNKDSTGNSGVSVSAKECGRKCKAGKINVSFEIEVDVMEERDGGKDGEPIKLPENLESLPKADHFPTQRHRWNTNEEIAAILISFERHNEWLSKEVKTRPKSGSMLLYSRKKVRYRRDGYCWKKRKDGKTTREDHMKLKVQGTECIYGCYVHSAILPTFHRRCYWLLQNPDIVLVHYLNVPYPDDNKLVITSSISLWGDKKEWTKEELISQLKPMFFSEDEPDLNNELEISTAETVEAIVTQLMEKQRQARQAALTKQLECGCPDSTCADSKSCAHPIRRITSAKTTTEVTVNAPLISASRAASAQNLVKMAALNDNNNQVSSTTCTSNIATSQHPGSLSSPADSTTGSSTSLGLAGIPHSIANSNGSTPLVLSLSQIQGGGGLLILNSGGGSVSTSSSSMAPVTVASFVCSQQPHGGIRNVNERCRSLNSIVKQESMETLPCQQQSLLDNLKLDVTNGNISFDTDETFSTLHHRSIVTQHHQRQIAKSVSSAPKPMDTSTGGVKSKYDVKSEVSFFNETLDLSQEDIQQTLSANMPLCAADDIIHRLTKAPTHLDHVESVACDINPMDFIDNDVNPTEDEVFVNLEAFDMLGDFSDLEPYEVGGGIHTSHCITQHHHPAHGGGGGHSVSDNTGGGGEKMGTQQHHNGNRMDYREGTANITDYSPEWAYPEGGVKVLVTGPWYSNSNPYAILFDGVPVPTTLVQSGVLRCFCPAHDVGLASVQVACEGYVISNAVIFEYKRPIMDNEQSSPVPILQEPTLETGTSSNDHLLKFTLMQRLEAMEGRLMRTKGRDRGPGGDTGQFQQGNFENGLVNLCQEMTVREWKNNGVNTLSDVESLKLSPTSHTMSLLHLAAALGYGRLVCALLHWRAENPSHMLESEVDALRKDSHGFTPLMWSCYRGHKEAALVLYRWNHTAVHITDRMGRSAVECARNRGHTTLAYEMEQMEEEAGREVTSSSNQRQKENEARDRVLKYHDYFLRPPSIAGSTSSSSTHNSSSFASTPSLSPLVTPTSYDAHTHGGPSRLTKRSSVDSGINLTMSSQHQSSTSEGRRMRKNVGRETPKLSRLDRSMSLPLTTVTPCNPADSSEHMTKGASQEPLKSKMDFALCEATAGPRSTSPIIDVEAVSDEEGDKKDTTTDCAFARRESISSCDLSLQSIAGEQDVRVLTLAEQIIAAMPERIKNESEDVMVHEPSPQLDFSGGSLCESNCELPEPMLEDTTTHEPQEFNFEFSDHSYRYYDVGTPSSSLSPSSSSCLQSPCSFTLDSPSPPPTTADFCEFFQASGILCEKDFSNLTLSDREQRELYEAAKIIQKAYRSYKGRKKAEEQEKERAAAIVIQNYYRRYKHYAYFKQMTRAALVIQNQFRNYCEHKRFKKSQETSNLCLSSYYRNMKDNDRLRQSREGTPTSSALKRSFSQRRQHQAARKIQQFMRQSKNKLQRERALAAERERQQNLSAPQVDTLRKFPSLDSSSRCWEGSKPHLKN